MRASLVGMKYRPPALDIVERLANDQPLLLVREPGNTHDRNAIAVYLQLGYIPKASAAKLAPLLDKQVGLVGTVKATFVYHPQWPQVEIADDPNAPVQPKPIDVQDNRVLNNPRPPVPGIDDDDEIPF